MHRAAPNLRHLAFLAAALSLVASEAAAQRPTEQTIVSRARRFAATPGPTFSPGCVPLQQPANVQVGNTQTTLLMDTATVQVGGVTYVRNVYNGQYTAPTLRMDTGQRVMLDVANHMTPASNQSAADVAETNQHFHGFVVTPLPDTGDNVNQASTLIHQGQTHAVRFPVSYGHAQGMMWYHPHPHGHTQSQVRGGLAGAFIIGDLLSYPQFAQYRGATEVVMQIKEMKRNDQTSELYLNGNVCSALTIRAGEQQFWRIGNFTSGNFLNLKLQGYRFTLLALDGNRFTRPVEVDSIPLAPGGRAEVIVTGGVGPWESKLYTAPVLTRPTSTSPRVDLLELQVVTAPMAMRAAGVAAAAEDRVLEDSIQQLAAAPSPKQFTLRFGTPPPTNGFELNGLLFDENRQDISIAVGEPQEWTLINTTDVLHTFHIHQTDFLVVRVNGHDVPETVHQDNVWLGIHRLPNGTVVGDTVVVRFTLLPVAAGPMVTHCHVLSHEDLGMMANICVYDPAKGQGPGWCISQGFYKYTRENMPRSSGQSHGHAIHASRPGSGANGR